ncbi:MAG TPA: imidazole glycerol phosphate synthase subunit HisH [Actinobacteria bacterium]|nr:imidazole glycerol phosphate synthase subunit HisH [Actinomycetota bacterium]
MTAVAVVDHGAGNLVSIAAALERAGADVRIVSDPDALADAAAVVLPGVGAVAAAMRGLRRTGMDAALAAWDGPLLGICVGLQVFFERSEEDGAVGLGLVAGTVERLSGRPLPHMGWNDVVHDGDPLFAGIPPGEPFYFVHSYAPVPDDAAVVAATTDHGGSFVSAVRAGRRVGVQFHPERSGWAGARLLENFLAEVEGAADAA